MRTEVKRMTNKLMIGLAIGAIFCLLAGCVVQLGEKISTPHMDGGNQQIANPSSEFCGARGGMLTIVDTGNGQDGICTLLDGTKCDEWEYYRGTCPAAINGSLAAAPGSERFPQRVSKID
jgi:putative hemolysin